VANPQRGEVSLEIGGREYVLALDLNAMCELEELLSTPEKPVSFQDVARGMMGSRMTYVRAFFWACLRRHHKEITVSGVSDLMSAAGGLAPFLEKVSALLAMTRPDEGDAVAVAEEGNGRAEEGNGRPPRAAAGAGAGAAATDGTGPRSIGKRAKSA